MVIQVDADETDENSAVRVPSFAAEERKPMNRHKSPDAGAEKRPSPGTRPTSITGLQTSAVSGSLPLMPCMQLHTAGKPAAGYVSLGP
ncbi:hypothetical protein LTR16_010399 [Cryomyces antarcticus]|uniref:Uncharacterized protein n=1 Tax=Cryomyces antarcticus TaxID=329879 RepID=A0ABR0M211_9PEZI|nr:hypothetical protein LTR16_010399 [Cryomyces antarcticus]